MQALGVADVRRELERLGMRARILQFDGSTATSQLAAERVGCELGQIVKSLGFLISKTRPVLILASGDSHVDERKLAALYGVGRKKARMMTAAQCLAILGYAPGAVPPIAHRADDLNIILDQRLSRYEVVYAAAGSDSALFPIELETLRRVTGADFADLARD